MSEQTVDLGRAAALLWGSRWRILAVAVAAGVLGLGLAFLRTDEYDANSVLFIQDIRIGAMRVSQEEKKTTPETFIRLLTNDWTLQRVIEDCGLAEPPMDYTIRSLRDRVDARVGRNASSIELSVTMPSARMALAVAESLISQATRYNEELIRQDVAASQRLLRAELNALERDLAAKTEAWRKVRSEARLESDVERIGQLELALRNVIDDHNMTAARMRQKRAEYESYRELLAAEPEMKILRQALVQTPALLEISREVSGAGDKSVDLLDLQLENETLNPVSTDLKAKVSMATAEYEGERMRLTELQERMGSLRHEIDTVQDRYNATYPLVMRAEKEFNAAQMALTDVVQTYAHAASEVFWERQMLRVVPPVLPDAPSGPNRLAFALAAAVLGGVLACIVVLVRTPAGAVIRRSD